MMTLEEAKDKLVIYNPPMYVEWERLNYTFPQGGQIFYDSMRVGNYVHVKAYCPEDSVSDANRRNGEICGVKYESSQVLDAREKFLIPDRIMAWPSERFFLADAIDEKCGEIGKWAENKGDVLIACGMPDLFDDCGNEIAVFAYSNASREEFIAFLEEHIPYCTDILTYSEYLERRKDVREKREKGEEKEKPNRSALEKLAKYVNNPEAYTELYTNLNTRVLGQDNLGEFCYAIFSFLRSVVDGTPKKHNILLTGPSGSGKSELCRALKDAIGSYGVDVVLADASNVTEAGYKGREPMDLFRHFIDKKETAPIGILVADEIDKKIRPSVGSGGVNVNRAVLEQLLIALEGGTIADSKSKLDTSNILIIGAGAFSYIREERAEEKVMGFGRDMSDSKIREHQNPYTHLTMQDVLEAGGFPEFLGRFDTVVQLRPLGKEDFRTLLHRHTEALGKAHHCTITCSAEYEEEAYERFRRSPLGCRSVYSELWSLLLPCFHECSMNRYSNVILTIGGDQQVRMLYGDNAAEAENENEGG